MSEKERIALAAEAFRGLHLLGADLDGEKLIERLFDVSHQPLEEGNVIFTFEDIETIANRIRSLQEIALQNTLIRE